MKVQVICIGKLPKLLAIKMKRCPTRLKAKNSTLPRLKALVSRTTRLKATRHKTLPRLQATNFRQCRLINRTSRRNKSLLMMRR